MLSITGLNHFYYVRDFSDMRCKHSRVLAIIHEQLHRKPDDGDVFIVMSKDRRIVRMFTYDNRSYSLFARLSKLRDNLTERTIRKLTIQRNNSLHFGSDAGVEMAAAYHSVISTVKLHGMSCWRYLGDFFQKIFKGCRDFLSLTPANIAVD